LTAHPQIGFWQSKSRHWRIDMTNFDERAKDWDSDPMKVIRAKTVAEAIRGAISLTKDMSALEYGCGTGLLSFALQADLGNITLADTSQGMLDVLAENICRMRRTCTSPPRPVC
jgi:ubiquinone/menaquinone biosynthesis C-methylase UbiE